MLLNGPKLSLLALALANALPAAAQSNEEILKRFEALQQRVDQLEKELKEAKSKAPGTPGGPQWGMTPEQAAELNRLTVKTEALEDSREASGFMGLKISGQMQTAYIYNQRQDLAGFQFLDSVANYGYNYWNSYIGMAILDFQKEMSDGTKWRLTLAPQRGVGSVIDGYSIVQEASVSVPLTDLQTRFIAGQIPDWSGYEYLQPTLNKLITHNLLFDFTLPTAYTGAGLEVTRGKWLSKVMLANVNASKRGAGETSPGVAYRVDYAKGEFQGFGFAGVHGKAANFRALDDDGNVTINPISTLEYSTKDTRIDLFELDAYFIRGDWTVQGQVSIGRQAHAAVTSDASTGDLRDAQWWGLSALAAYKFEPRLEGTIRADYINNRKNGGGLLGYTGSDDRNGLGPDATLGCDPTLAGGGADGCDRGVNRSALTFGLSYLYNLNTTFKFEYRLDHASGPVFLDAKDGSYKKNNQLIGASVLVSF